MRKAMKPKIFGRQLRNKMKNLFTKRVGLVDRIHKFLIGLVFCSLQSTAFAVDINGTPHKNHLASSDFIMNTINFLNDGIGVFTPIAVLVCGGLAMYFIMRQNAATEEQDRSKWHKRIFMSVYSAVGITVIRGVIYVITLYFK